MKTFLDQCLEGSASPPEVDDYVDAWHDGLSSVTLREFLGFTPEEYGLWLKDAESINVILHCRRHGITLSDYLKGAA